MEVEFYEAEVKGKVKAVTKLHIRKIMQEKIVQTLEAEVVNRPATKQDQEEFKVELEEFLAKGKSKAKVEKK